MIKPNFEQMTKSELKAYLVEHPNDTQAFHVLMDKINANPNPVSYTLEDIDRLEELIEVNRQSQAGCSLTN